MSCLSVRAWVVLAGGRIQGFPFDRRLPVWPQLRACCDGSQLSDFGNVYPADVVSTIPTCPECSMIRESLLLALEKWP